MTPGARLSAAIEVLDAIAVERARADEVLKAWGRAHRFAGSGDRRAIAERVYAVLRARTPIAWRMGADDGRALVVGSLAEVDGLAPEAASALLNGEGHAPQPLSPDEHARLCAPPTDAPAHVRAGVPAWIAALLEARFGAAWEVEARALIGGRAPLDLRLNRLRGGREAALRLLAHDRLEPEPTPWSALGLRLPPTLSLDIHRTRAFADGWIEVQDEASQIAAALSGAAPGMTVVDYCAGGGGKTLALAAMLRAPFPLADGGRVEDGGEGAMAAGGDAGGASLTPSSLLSGRTPTPGPSPIEGEGRLVALDVNPKRLDALAPRLARAGAQAGIRRIGANGEGADDLAACADLVFVDAPCTGSGTWRRHPEACFRLTPESLERLAALQPRILARAATLVRPGGRLLYATCSVFEAENEAVAAAFAAAHPAFRPLPIAAAAGDARGLTPAGRARLAELAAGAHTLQLTPARSGTDGFFVALFERSSA